MLVSFELCYGRIGSAWLEGREKEKKSKGYFEWRIGMEQERITGGEGKRVVK
jgi:hypothetical protein